MNFPDRLIAHQDHFGHIQDIRAATGADTEMLPIAFDGMAGWLHRPVGASSSVGVVIVPPIGRDARCAQLSLRILGEAAAAAGHPVLRYHPRGQGESLEVGADEDVVGVWRQAVGLAIAALRTETGCTSVVLAGLRLGGDLALLENAGADGLVLMAPMVQGRRWVRLLRLSAQVSGTLRAGTGLETDGLQLDAKTLQALSAMDLLTTPIPKMPILLAGGSDALAAHLSAGNARVDRTQFEELDTLFLDADVNHPPLKLFAEVVEWLGRLEQQQAEKTPRRQPPAILSGPGFTECPVRFGADLRGILTLPEATRRPGMAVVFLSTGGEPCSGVGRFAVLAGRELAAAGIASFRFDFAGIGDSPGPDGVLCTHVFETDRTADLDAVADFLSSQGLDQLIATGICSGAYHAIYWAGREPRVNAIMPMSAIKLVWRAGEAVAPDAAALGRATSVYKAGIKDPRTWWRLLRGDIDVVTVARTLVRRYSERVVGAMDRRGAGALREAVRSLSSRGGRMRLFLGDADSSLDELATYFGPGGSRLKKMPGMSLQVSPGLNHGLAVADSRSAAMAALQGFVGEL